MRLELRQLKSFEWISSVFGVVRRGIRNNIIHNYVEDSTRDLTVIYTINYAYNSSIFKFEDSRPKLALRHVADVYNLIINIAKGCIDEYS